MRVYGGNHSFKFDQQQGTGWFTGQGSAVIVPPTALLLFANGVRTNIGLGKHLNYIKEGIYAYPSSLSERCNCNLETRYKR